MTAQGQGGGRLRGTNTTSPSGKAREGGGCGGGGKVLEWFGSMGVRLVGVGIIVKQKSLKMMLHCVAVTKTPQEWDKCQRLRMVKLS